MIPIRQLAADFCRKTCLKLFMKSCFLIVLAFGFDDGTQRYTAVKDTSEMGSANHNRYERQFAAPEKNRAITRDPRMAANDPPAIIHPTAFGLSLKIKNSPTKVRAIAPIIVVPIPSMGKKICMNRKLGATRHPRIPIVTAMLPRNNSFLWL